MYISQGWLIWIVLLGILMAILLVAIIVHIDGVAKKQNLILLKQQEMIDELRLVKKEINPSLEDIDYQNLTRRPKRQTDNYRYVRIRTMKDMDDFTRKNVGE